MRPGWKYLVGVTLVAPTLMIVTLGQRPGSGDEPGRLGRLFRFGVGAPSATAPPTSSPPPGTPETTAPSYPSPSPPAPATEGAPLGAFGTSSTPRIVARPRVSRPVTESDPLVTRITLHRSDDGTQFGMFLQVFADGTVIDGEGVHHVGNDVLKPLVVALQSGELSRLKGHCGAPAADSIESAQVVVYERSLGRLRANAFSYSGNPQGCDGSLRNLHATLDNLQAKVARPMPAGATGGMFNTPSPDVPPPGGSPNVIPLTPAQ